MDDPKWKKGDSLPLIYNAVNFQHDRKNIVLEIVKIFSRLETDKNQLISTFRIRHILVILEFGHHIHQSHPALSDGWVKL